ncbi:MAG TPA: hypothetical protein DCX06_13620 [Opitutae bacterium]|nr:hypothetical protein [Opitutae bacterium]
MAAKKSAKQRKKPKQERGIFAGLLRGCFILSILCIVAVGAIYYFASFETRERMDGYAKQTLNKFREAESMPNLLVGILDTLYDTVPSSEGLIVDGGELGRDNGPFLAGIPQTRIPVRLLHNTAYVSLFNEVDNQPICVAFKLIDENHATNTSPASGTSDPRVPSLQLSDLQSSNWQATPLAPPRALANTYSDKGGYEAMLLTNFVPIKQGLANTLWQDAMTEVAIRYPKRFDEVWIYAGPAYHKQRKQLSSGVPLPDALYVIAFDLTDSGGLRAIAFWIPTNATNGTKLSNCITSIAYIQNQTGIQFLPELGFDSKDLLQNWVSPTLW